MSKDYQEHFRHHSKTFSFAARFFGKKHAEATAKLYYFFRYVDDIADNCDENQSHKTELINSSIHSKELNEIKATYKIPSEIIESFIQASINDIDFHKMESQKKLFEYCYGVASTVGLAMCHVLGVKKKEAFFHAIDLGVAMQLTNICRDVFEDFSNNRIYLPELNKNHFEKNKQAQIHEIQRQYLDMADKYYKSGFEGLSYLPFRARIVIYIAAKLYQKIGSVIKQDKDYKKRSHLKASHKIIYTIGYLPKYLCSQIFKRRYIHDSNLHLDITGYTYSNARS